MTNQQWHSQAPTGQPPFGGWGGMPTPDGQPPQFPADPSRGQISSSIQGMQPFGVQQPLPGQPMQPTDMQFGHDPMPMMGATFGQAPEQQMGMLPEQTAGMRPERPTGMQFDQPPMHQMGIRFGQGPVQPMETPFGQQPVQPMGMPPGQFPEQMPGMQPDQPIRQPIDNPFMHQPEQPQLPMSRFGQQQFEGQMQQFGNQLMHQEAGIQPRFEGDQQHAPFNQALNNDAQFGNSAMPNPQFGQQDAGHPQFGQPLPEQPQFGQPAFSQIQHEQSAVGNQEQQMGTLQQMQPVQQPQLQQPDPQPRPFEQQPDSQPQPFGQQPQQSQPFGEQPQQPQPQPLQPQPFGQQPAQQPQPFGQQSQPQPFGQQPQLADQRPHGLHARPDGLPSATNPLEIAQRVGPISEEDFEDDFEDELVEEEVPNELHLSLNARGEVGDIVSRKAKLVGERPQQVDYSTSREKIAPDGSMRLISDKAFLILELREDEEESEEEKVLEEEIIEEEPAVAEIAEKKDEEEKPAVPEADSATVPETDGAIVEKKLASIDISAYEAKPESPSEGEPAAKEKASVKQPEESSKEAAEPDAGQPEKSAENKPASESLPEPSDNDVQTDADKGDISEDASVYEDMFQKLDVVPLSEKAAKGDLDRRPRPKKRRKRPNPKTDERPKLPAASTEKGGEKPKVQVIGADDNAGVRTIASSDEIRAKKREAKSRAKKRQKKTAAPVKGSPKAIARKDAQAAKAAKDATAAKPQEKQKPSKDPQGPKAESTDSKPAKKPKYRRALPTVAVVILAIAAIILAAFAILIFTGQQNLLFAQSIEVNPNAQSFNGGRVVVYKDKKYRINDNMTTVLMIGSDNENSNPDEGYNGQADAVVALAINGETGKVTAIQIPRDSMVEIDRNYFESNEMYDVRSLQLCLAYSYGVDDKQSSEMVCTAVSRILYNMPIDYYYTLKMSGMIELIDSVGGVEVTALERIPKTDIYAGEDVNLTGDDAWSYIKWRSTKEYGTALGRQDRQKQVLQSLGSKVLTFAKADPSALVNLYETLSAQSTTNLGMSEVSYLASMVLEKGISDVELTALRGELTHNDETSYAEMHLDKDAVYQTLLDVYYTCIGPADNGMVEGTVEFTHPSSSAASVF